MKILINEELASRERLGILFLRDALIENGHQVELTSSWNVDLDRFSYKPDMIIENISDTEAHYMGKYYGYNGFVLNLYWEQLLSPLNIHRGKMESEFVDNFIDARFSWGERFKTIFSQLNSVAENETPIVGSLNQFVNLMTSKSALSAENILELYHINIEKFKHIILVTDTFKAATNSVKKHVQHHPYYKELHFKHTLYHERLPKIINKVAVDNEDILFIVRAHPHKTNDYYSEFSRKFKGGAENVIIQKGGPIAPLVQASDLVISHKSGTLIDAYSMQTKACNLIFDDDYTEKYGLLPHVTDSFGEQCCENSLQKIIAERDFVFNKKPACEMLYQSVYSEKSDSAISNICSFIEEMSNQQPKSRNSKNRIRRHTLKRVIRCQLRQFLNRLFPLRVLRGDDFDYEKLYKIISEKN